jgi:hypothetical protein
LGDFVGFGDFVGSGESVTDGAEVAVGVGESDTDGVGSGEEAGSCVGDGIGSCVGDGVGSCVGDGAGFGEGVGCGAGGRVVRFGGAVRTTALDRRPSEDAGTSTVERSDSRGSVSSLGADASSSGLDEGRRDSG